MRYAPGKDQREAQMILNHKAAIEMLVDSVDETGFDLFDRLLATAAAIEDPFEQAFFAMIQSRGRLCDGSGARHTDRRSCRSG